MRMISSSRFVHASLEIEGLRWLCHRSRHCLPMRPGILAAICDHFRADLADELNEELVLVGAPRALISPASGRSGVRARPRRPTALGVRRLVHGGGRGRGRGRGRGATARGKGDEDADAGSSAVLVDGGSASAAAIALAGAGVVAAASGAAVSGAASERAAASSCSPAAGAVEGAEGDTCGAPAEDARTRA